jgi:hypothetical protein
MQLQVLAEACQALFILTIFCMFVTSARSSASTHPANLVLLGFRRLAKLVGNRLLSADVKMQKMTPRPVRWICYRYV